MAVTSRNRRQGDGSAVVRGWVALYTVGLPAAIRMRRRDELDGDLADEALDAVRRGRQATLRRQRVVRVVAGIPADLQWRFIDAPAMARDQRTEEVWAPLTRWSAALIAIVIVGAVGALAIVTLPQLTGQARSADWSGWGPAGFTFGCLAALAGVLTSIRWPARGAAIVLPGIVVGSLASPWLWGCWFLALIAVGVRWYQADLFERSDPRR
ncbi:MAG: hypothetical protein ACSLFN_01555 [Candidatus Limnocylindrales bacterium]